MSKQLKTANKDYQTSFETETQDSRPLAHIKKISKAKNKKKRSTKMSNKNVLQIYPIKILRFNLKHLKRTLRVPCYKEQQLNMPIRFTKKLNAMQADNDLQTDQEVVQHQIDRCSNWLKEAILAHQSEPKQEN